jgi:hypothetical protein
LNAFFSSFHKFRKWPGQGVGESGIEKFKQWLSKCMFFSFSYDRIDELIWVKTNQLQRIIRTGRTGHWLNHGKEHCLIGKKGSPQGVNKGIDADVLVAEVSLVQGHCHLVFFHILVLGVGSGFISGPIWRAD